MDKIEIGNNLALVIIMACLTVAFIVGNWPKRR